jgi:hypothetical protein
LPHVGPPKPALASSDPFKLRWDYSSKRSSKPHKTHVPKRRLRRVGPRALSRRMGSSKDSLRKDEWRRFGVCHREVGIVQVTLAIVAREAHCRSAPQSHCLQRSCWTWSSIDVISDSPNQSLTKSFHRLQHLGSKIHNHNRVVFHSLCERARFKITWRTL